MQQNHEDEQRLQNLNTILLCKLSSAVNGHAAIATFACGGLVPILETPTITSEAGTQIISPPLKIRWDAELGSKSSISFPPSEDLKLLDDDLEALLHKCQPATFGIEGQDVLDEAYRKASQLDTSAFSTNFHPHDCGILDSIQQILLPSTIRDGQRVGVGPQGVRAELYKLNVTITPRLKPLIRGVDTDCILSDLLGTIWQVPSSCGHSTKFYTVRVARCMLTLSTRRYVV